LRTAFVQEHRSPKVTDGVGFVAASGPLRQRSAATSPASAVEELPDEQQRTEKPLTPALSPHLIMGRGEGARRLCRFVLNG
jgi:hypothetical protein